jgi:hypothetical protein
VGRPSALTPDVHTVIVDALEKGAYIATACSAAGVSEAAYHRWMAWGEEHEELEEHPPLRDDFTTAKAHKSALTKHAKRLEQLRAFREFRESCTRARARPEILASTALLDALSAERTVSVRVEGEKGEYHVVTEADHGVRYRAGEVFLKRRYAAERRWGDKLELEHAGEVVIGERRIPLEELTPEEKRAYDRLVELSGEVGE